MGWGALKARIIIIYSKGWIHGFGNGIDNRVAMVIALIPPALLRSLSHNFRSSITLVSYPDPRQAAGGLHRK